MHRPTKPFLILHFEFLILFLPFAFCLLPCSYADYAAGAGSPEFPFQIAEPNHLIELSQHPEDWGLSFILTADIELSPEDVNMVITGNYCDSFTGRFGIKRRSGYARQLNILTTQGTEVAELIATKKHKKHKIKGHFGLDSLFLAQYNHILKGRQAPPEFICRVYKLKRMTEDYLRTSGKGVLY